MTSLDDALNSSAPVFDAPTLYVDWRESTLHEGDGVDNVYNLSDTLEGSYTVEHSFDDGLPDPVTLTGSNDASGQMKATMIGRAGTTYSGWTVPGSVSGENAFSSNFITTTIPSSLPWGSHLVMAITVPSATATLTQDILDNTPYAWDYVTKQTSGAITLWVFTKKSYTGMAAPVFYSDELVANTVWACTALRATDPTSHELVWRINATSQASAGGSATAHVQPSITSTSDRATYVAVWSAPGPSSWTVGGSDTLLTQFQNASNSIVMARTALYLVPNTRADITATRAVATATVAKVTLAFEPFERPNMGPTEFWSPFNLESPIYGRDRDTAGVELIHNTLTDTGVQGVTLFTGQMNDVSMTSDQAVGMDASSLARTTLNRSLSLPMVFARREGGSIDFLVAWIIARADRFIGPAPGYQTRWWVPCYGSLHAGLDSPYGYNFAQYWTAASVDPVQIQYPTFVEGPFHTAAYAQHTVDKTIEISLAAEDLYRANEIWPWVTEEYLPTQYLNPLFAFDNNAGRISFWIRGDATYAGTPTNVPTGNRFLASFALSMFAPSGSVLGHVQTYIDTDRNLYVYMGSTVGGFTTLFWSGGYALPTDDAWHFYSISWSYDEGTMKVNRDGNIASTSQFATNGNNDFTGWYDDEASLYAAGGRIITTFRSHLPLSDVVMEAGYDAYNTGADVWPTTPWPSFTAETRPTTKTIEAVPDDTPVNGWSVLADLARNTMSWYRANEDDDIEFFPPSYFAEPDQQLVSYVTDTEKNAQNVAIVMDPAKSRNAVTVKYTETTVDAVVSPVLVITSAITIPPGTSDVIFPLDEKIAEIFGASNAYGVGWRVVPLDQADVTTGPDSTPFGSPYMTINTKIDGTGVYLINPSISGRITEATQTTVTIHFINKTGKDVYMVNNYQGNADVTLPFLRVLGYAVRESDSYVTERDGGSIGVRRERAMEVEMGWVQSRQDATQMASALVSLVARPRPEVGVVVQGDPRRYPGELVTLADAETTHASGNWRVLYISHNADGAEFTQSLQLVGVYPVALWDVSKWDYAAWGE